MTKILLVDYENVQNINLEKIPKKDFMVYLFIGESQNKIPFNMVIDAQKFGEKLIWIKIDGNGSNALDFHIAFYLGNMANEKSNDEYIILSKDKGFDPLIRYVLKKNIKCKRINSINEIFPNESTSIKNISELEKVIDNLKKIGKPKRPRKRSTLIKHMKTLIGKQFSDQAINDLVDELFIEKYITEENGNLKYNF